MAPSANLDKILDKAYESSSPAELIDAPPVSALAGVRGALVRTTTPGTNYVIFVGCQGVWWG